MSENKPQWYNDLTNGPLVSVPKPTLEILDDIERRANSTNAPRINKSLIWIPLAFCFILVLMTVGNLPGKEINSTHSSSDYEKVFDSKGNLIAMDKKWLMSRNLFDAYRAFSESKTDEILMGMEPLGIFKMYIFASVNGDYDTLYALFIQGYGTPSREAYLAEIAKDLGLQERSKSQWDAWKKNYRLQEEVHGNQAAIRMISPESLSISEPSFRVIKNEKGIWKVVWPSL